MVCSTNLWICSFWHQEQRQTMVACFRHRIPISDPKICVDISVDYINFTFHLLPVGTLCTRPTLFWFMMQCQRGQGAWGPVSVLMWHDTCRFLVLQPYTHPSVVNCPCIAQALFTNHWHKHWIIAWVFAHVYQMLSKGTKLSNSVKRQSASSGPVMCLGQTYQHSPSYPDLGCSSWLYSWMSGWCLTPTCLTSLTSVWLVSYSYLSHLTHECLAGVLLLPVSPHSWMSGWCLTPTCLTSLMNVWLVSYSYLSHLTHECLAGVLLLPVSPHSRVSGWCLTPTCLTSLTSVWLVSYSYLSHLTHECLAGVLLLPVSPHSWLSSWHLTLYLCQDWQEVCMLIMAWTMPGSPSTGKSNSNGSATHRSNELSMNYGCGQQVLWLWVI